MEKEPDQLTNQRFEVGARKPLPHDVNHYTKKQTITLRCKPLPHKANYYFCAVDESVDFGVKSGKKEKPTENDEKKMKYLQSRYEVILRIMKYCSFHCNMK